MPVGVENTHTVVARWRSGWDR